MSAAANIFLMETGAFIAPEQHALVAADVMYMQNEKEVL
jgi:hypothetical protein